MKPKTAVLYTRVSSREQEQEGFSLDAQSKLLGEYAKRTGFEVVRAFEDVETAKVSGRKQFTEMVAYLEKNQSCRTLIVEKTDRLYRNRRDALTIEELEIEVHFVKEAQILSKDSKSQVKFMQDIRLAVAQNYSENLREEVKKGMCEKAAQGTYPGRAPFGYRNNKGERTIEVHPEKGEIAKRTFELFASGNYSLLALGKALERETGTRISKTNLHKMLKNPFYVGRFKWGGHIYQGKHEKIITFDLYERAQLAFRASNRPKYSKHDIAFRGMLTCAHDACTITAELKKNRYVYYRCSGHKGKCALPRFREQEISDRLGDVLKDVYIPDAIVRNIETRLQSEQLQMRSRLAVERARTERELATLRTRMDAAYTDKLDGAISEDFWKRKQCDWEREEGRIESRMMGDNRKARPATN
jgi:site-specific DNA recombinase